MPDFTDEQITLVAQIAETELASDLSAIIERYSFTVTVGQAEFTLGSNVTGIARVFWKGKRLLASRTNIDLVNSGSVPFSSTPGTPLEYVTTFVGVPTIRLYPSPSEGLSIGTGDLWSPTNIENKFIVECVISPTFTSTDLRVPSFIRRHYVKDQVLHRLLRREGKAMDPQAAAYFKKKFESNKVEIAVIRTNLFSCIPKQMQPVIGSGYKLARPVLPSNFGTVVE